jgi:hypothetical protein
MIYQTKLALKNPLFEIASPEKARNDATDLIFKIFCLYVNKILYYCNAFPLLLILITNQITVFYQQN